MLTLPNIADPIRIEIPGFEKIHAEIKSRPEDFRVDELPREGHGSTGDQIRFRIEKCGLTTEEVLVRISEVTGAAKDSIGVAGLKDKQAVTTQFVTMPEKYESKLHHVDSAGLKIIEMCGKSPKLRRGGSAGNAFTILLRGAPNDGKDMVAKALARMGDQGLPNAYGPQRFGNDQSTWALGLKLLLNGDEALSHLPGKKKKFMRRLALNAVQAGIYNRWLQARLDADQLGSLVHGDVIWVQRLGTAQLVLDLEREQARLAEGSVQLTGPLFGIKMRAAVGAAAGLEKETLAHFGLSLSQFAPFAKIAPGSRRHALIYPKACQVTMSTDGLQLNFTLPPGAYATVLLAALVHPGRHLL